MTHWLSLGANLGALVGIILLIMQLQQNRELTRAQVRHELAMAIVELLQTPASNQQLADVLYRANSGQELTPGELYQFELRTNALLRYWEDVHYQYRVGLYDEIEFGRQREAWRASIANSPRAIAYWCSVRALYSPAFAAELDHLLADGACASYTADPLLPAHTDD